MRQRFVPPIEYADLEIRILQRQPEGYPVEMTLNGEQEFPRGYLTSGVLPWVPSASPREDGERLFGLLFADDRLRSSWSEICGQSPLRRIRLRIDALAPELPVIPWKLLREVTSGLPPQTLVATANTPLSATVAQVLDTLQGALLDVIVGCDVDDTFGLAEGAVRIMAEESARPVVQPAC